MIGYRRWQGTIALKLLTDRGLPENEARAHISMVKQTQRLPLFAKAVQIAGLESGADVASQQEQEMARKEAELQSIYGSANEPEAMPQAQFAPRMQMSQASSQAASEAAALFFDDEPAPAPKPTVANDFDELLEPQTKASPQPSSAGIELPEPISSPSEEPPAKTEEPVAKQPSADVNLLRGACSSCGLEFQVPMPIDVKEAIVICPSCSSCLLYTSDAADDL